MASALAAHGWSVERIRSLPEYLTALGTRDYEALILGRGMGDGGIEQMLEAGRRRQPRIAAVLLGGDGGPQEVLRLARLGLDDYLPETVSGEALAERLRGVVAQRRAGSFEALRASQTVLIGRSRAIRQVAETVRLIAGRRSTVLITGPTGTGKELVARLVHELSPRAAREMVTVNCGAIPEHLMEAEFFGHVRGAFTGAVAARVGRFEQADGSTLFLDEIGDMPLELQAKVLRAIQEREFQRVGSSETTRVDIRVIAATNCDLWEKVRRGEFREDLYYRLNVVPIVMPPLAERLEDVPWLVEHFLERVCRREGLPLKRAGREVLERLGQYHWPGNVRQLENAVEQAVALSGERVELYPSDFPMPERPPRVDPGLLAGLELPAGGIDLDAFLTRVELNLLEQALERTGGNKNRAARMLGLKRTTLSAKLKSCRAAKI